MDVPEPGRLRFGKGVPLTSLVVDADDGENERYGKDVADLQEDVVVNGNGKITGTLKYVTGYTGWTSEVAKQQGNYLALVFDAAEGSTITAGIGGASVDVSSDKYLVLRVDETRLAQPLTITATKSGDTETRVFDLGELVLEAAE